MRYIWESNDWPNFTWDSKKLLTLTANAAHHQGRLLGRMDGLGFDLQDQAQLHALTDDVVNSSEIEGEDLPENLVRSSIARRLGMKNIKDLVPSPRDVDSVVAMMTDATAHYDKPLTQERLFEWHRDLFDADTTIKHIVIGRYRLETMAVVSGPYGNERTHFEAPPAYRLHDEMNRFLKWFEKPHKYTSPLLHAGIAHLWFVTIHPFDDGNGRIARAITDMALARAENNNRRFYSMSKQILKERNAYYDMLEQTQKGECDITPWLEWFLNCLIRAIKNADSTVGTVLMKAKFWQRNAEESLNERQIKMLNMLLDGFEGKLKTDKWAKITKCSPDTALRDINDLIKRRILKKDSGGGRSTSYSLAPIEVGS
ncbi:MAG: Fic family protein [Pseudomonadales bacterium]